MQKFMVCCGERSSVKIFDRLVHPRSSRQLRPPAQVDRNCTWLGSVMHELMEESQDLHQAAPSYSDLVGVISHPCFWREQRFPVNPFT